MFSYIGTGDIVMRWYVGAMVDLSKAFDSITSAQYVSLPPVTS